MEQVIFLTTQSSGRVMRILTFDRKFYEKGTYLMFSVELKFL